MPIKFKDSVKNQKTGMVQNYYMQSTSIDELKEGEKVGETDRQANTVAGIRTVWWLTHMITCLAIITNAIANHGWGLIGL